MNELTTKQQNAVMKTLPKKYSNFKKLSSYGIELFKEEKLIEIKIKDKTYTGKCFINHDKKSMDWRPMHKWYVYIDDVEDCYSWDLLKDKPIRIIPTDVQLNKFYEKKLKEILKRGQHHLNETKKAYVDLQEFKEV